jgi:hypothetical protein
VTTKGNARFFQVKLRAADDAAADSAHPLVAASNGSQGNRFVKDADL